MIVISTSYSPMHSNAIRDYVSQYRCPTCQSYNLEVTRLANAADASTDGLIRNGQVECCDCKHGDTGEAFYVSTTDVEQYASASSVIEKLKNETGDEWVYNERDDSEDDWLFEDDLPKLDPQ